MAPLPQTEPPRAELTPRPHRVLARRRETADTWTLTLEPLAGQPRLEFSPGQFAMLYAFGAGEVPISTSGDPTRGPLAHTVRAVGAVTRALCAATRGRVIGVRGPYGNAWPIAGAGGADIVIVAGGIGLAPLRPVMYRALAHRRRYGRVILLYGARTPGDLLYTRELDRWRDAGAHVRVTVDAAPAGWRGTVGVVPALLGRVPFAAGSAVAFVCGPEIMMRFAALRLLELGMPADRVHVSMERDMRCGVGLCGHCQLGPTLVCRDGPVYTWDAVSPLLAIREL